MSKSDINRNKKV